MGASRTYSNKMDRENECNSGQESSTRTRWKRRRNKKELLYNGYRQGEELLYP